MYKGAAAILDTILNYTFLPHICNVYPSFFHLQWVPYTDHESKLGDISLHTGPPSAPGLQRDKDVTDCRCKINTLQNDFERVNII